MQVQIKIHKQLSLAAFIFLLLSCNSNVVFDQYIPIEDQQWPSEKGIDFIVNNLDTISANNVFINIRNNKDYEFSSLFLIAKIELPNGYKVIDTLEYEMTDASGNWLGSGFTDLKENKLFYKENVVFSEIGIYKFNIQNATRGINDIQGKNPLKGITDVGLSIEKIKK
ncbi:MAG: gliding motility lipoprotein GldH [Lutibacter sp.]|nr:gliding motility lipoprotein GldH [Lutibacter sp.]